MQRKKAVTLTDIAREVGVSAMTVSAVLNGSNSTVRVSEETRTRVREAAMKLQYRPNAVARGLSSRRMNTIGVIAEFTYPGDMNLILHQLLNGILEGCVVYGQRTTIYSVSKWGIGQKAVLDFCDGLVDGFVLLGPDLTEEVASRLYRASPIVAIHNVGALSGALNIEIDGELGAYMMTRHLVSVGHRRIAHITGSPTRSGSDARLKGYRRGLAESGVEFDQSLVVRGMYSLDSGQEATRQLLSRFKRTELPTAIFSASDSMACGAIDVLTSHGISVPGEVSVAGFDDTPISQLTGIRLTTVSQPLSPMGVYAVSRLLRAIDEEIGTVGELRKLIDSPNTDTNLVEFDKVVVTGNTAMFMPTLIIRDSVVPPRAM